MTVFVQCDAEKTTHPQNLLAKNMQRSGLLYKSQIFYKVR